jgi:hypothetical protein
VVLGCLVCQMGLGSARGQGLAGDMIAELGCARRVLGGARRSSG